MAFFRAAVTLGESRLYEANCGSPLEFFSFPPREVRRVKLVLGDSLISSIMDLFSLAEVLALPWVRRRSRKNRKRKRIHELNIKRPDFGNFDHLFPDLLSRPEKIQLFYKMASDFLKRKSFAYFINSFNTKKI